MNCDRSFLHSFALRRLVFVKGSEGSSPLGASSCHRLHMRAGPVKAPPPDHAGSCYLTRPRAQPHLLFLFSLSNAY